MKIISSVLLAFIDSPVSTFHLSTLLMAACTMFTPCCESNPSQHCRHHPHIPGLGSYDNSVPQEGRSLPLIIAVVTRLSPASVSLCVPPQSVLMYGQDDIPVLDCCSSPVGMFHPFLDLALMPCQTPFMSYTLFANSPAESFSPTVQHTVQICQLCSYVITMQGSSMEHLVPNIYPPPSLSFHYKRYQTDRLKSL